MKQRVREETRKRCDGEERLADVKLGRVNYMLG